MVSCIQKKGKKKKKKKGNLIVDLKKYGKEEKKEYKVTKRHRNK